MNNLLKLKRALELSLDDYEELQIYIPTDVPIQFTFIGCGQAADKFLLRTSARVIDRDINRLEAAKIATRKIPGQARTKLIKFQNE